MKIVMSIWFSTFVHFLGFMQNAQHIVSALTCNGMEKLCDLRLNQVTLAGTHNSGAGFDSHMKYHTVLGPVLAGSCWYRSQDMSITSQLNFGIRYFDIDTCWEKGRASFHRGAWTCHADAYGGTIKSILNQVDHWMNRNRNEVIVLHFNRDIEKGKEKEIGTDIVSMLEAKWKPTVEKTKAGKLVMQSSMYATLGDSIRENRRIYVIFHSRLLSGRRPTYLHSEYYIGYTWHTMSFIESNQCSKMVDTLGSRCKVQANSGRSLIRLDLFLTWGLCTYHLADYCNGKASAALKKCMEGISGHRKTLNFIVVDFPERGGKPSIVEVARRQNLQNIKLFAK